MSVLLRHDGRRRRLGHGRAGMARAVQLGVLLVLVALGSLTGPARAGASTIRIGAPLRVRPVARGFLGLSFEYYVLSQYAGTDPAALDPVFLSLVRQLSPGVPPQLRIGGDSTDWAWVPTPGVAQPVGIRETLTPALTKLLAAIGTQLDARFILGINLEADSPPIAAQEARTLLATIGRAHLSALELGNEPDLYDVLSWTGGGDQDVVLGRPLGYSLADYTADFNRLAAALPAVPLAGPAAGGAAWMGNLESFSTQAARLKILTVHDYPLETCGSTPGQASYPSIAQLLAPASSQGLAQGLIPYAQSAHEHGQQIRIDEINSVACFGALGVSNTFASALWTLETSLDLAREGIDGVNFHELPGGQYRAFNFYRSHGAPAATVFPDYYGLLAFADAVPPGSRFLAAPSTVAGASISALVTPQGATRVIVVNPGGALALSVAVPGARGPAASITLSAPSLASTSGVTLGGQRFATPTLTGTLTGPPKVTNTAPEDGRYPVRVPAHSALILTLN